MQAQGLLTAGALYFDETRQTWLPLADLIATLTPPALLPLSPPPLPASSPAAVVVYSHSDSVAPSYRPLVTASWILLGLVCLLALVPFLGFTAWFFAAPVLLITLVLSIVILARGGTVAGLCLLGGTLVGAPLFILCAPVLTSAGTLAAAAAASDRAPVSAPSHSDGARTNDSNDAPIPSARREPDRTPAAPIAQSTGPAAVTVPAEPPAPTPRRQPEKTWEHPHIYIQLANESQRPAAAALRQRLVRSGYEVQGIENTAGNPHVPTEASELRYFANRDAAEAERIVREISSSFAGGGLHADLPENMPYVSHARQYEIWYSAAFSAGPGHTDSRSAAGPAYTVAAVMVETPPPRAVPVASAVPFDAPTPALAPAGPPLETLPELSPERALTEVMTNDPGLTVANFRARYSGHAVRYTGTVVRKNLKELLLVFRGGGFMATAYDVQASLGVDASPGFRDIGVGERVTVVAVVDRLVPPPFGVGSSSIRLSDARVYRRGR